jgi:hypothetical protein
VSKLGVIVPYRNRYEQLTTFKESITKYLESKNIDFELIIVEQDDAKLFNRGMLLNIGFKYAKKLKCDYVVFHDVDMLPIDVDYSYSEIPLHMATDFIVEEGEKERSLFDTYFGGVTMFLSEQFEEIDGYSNKYWGWGYEDNDLLLRCEEKFIKLDTLKIKNLGRKGKALKFNGIKAYVKAKNNIDFRSNATFFISFHPDNLELNHLKESDEFTAFSVPGYDLAVCYSSFSRYNFCAFDGELNALYVNSNIKTNYKTNLTITLDILDNIFRVYQDGIFIGQTKPYKRLHKYQNEPFFYLGVGKPDRETIPNFFKGHIDSFSYYDKILNDSEILEISNNNSDLKKYKSSNDLKLYYDANYISEYKLIDLSGNDNKGEIVNCEIVDYEFEDYKEIKIPYRRNSLFQSLKHEENGFLNNRWKDDNTRWNQLRFHNEVSNNDELVCGDGLSDLQFIEHGLTKENNITHINVGV